MRAGNYIILVKKDAGELRLAYLWTQQAIVNAKMGHGVPPN